MLGNIGPLEIAIVLVIALIVFGPKRLPELGSSLGRGIREFKETVTGERKDDDEDVKAISVSQATATAPVDTPTEAEKAPVEAEKVAQDERP